VHVLLIADQSRLRLEQDILRQLAQKLAEQVDLTCIGPEPAPDSEPDTTFQQTDIATHYAQMPVMPWLRRTRKAIVTAELEREPPDVIYALGERAWQLANDLTGTLEAPVALEIWCERQTRMAPRGRSATAVAAYLAPTGAIAASLDKRVDAGLVRLVPMGVPVPPDAQRIFDHPDDSMALSIIGGARDVPAYQALLSGLSRMLADFPQAQVFIELHGPNEHEIWREIRRLDLLDRVSVLSDLVEHRALLLGSDMLLCPERFGEVRSIVYEALAHGVPVIAADDPHLDLAEAAPATTVLERSNTEAWAHAVHRILNDPSSAREAGRQGRQWVLENHDLDSHVERLVDTFQRILTGGAVRLEQVEPS
jgi:hypothetical protein